jgi:hypothetical protein
MGARFLGHRSHCSRTRPTGIAGTAAGIAKILFGVFLFICLLFLILSIFVGKKIT